jgi:hypothetical protein
MEFQGTDARDGTDFAHAPMCLSRTRNDLRPIQQLAATGNEKMPRLLVRIGKE